MNQLLRLGQIQNMLPQRAASCTLRSNMSHLVRRDRGLETTPRANFSGGNDEAALPGDRTLHSSPLLWTLPELFWGGGQSWGNPATEDPADSKP